MREPITTADLIRFRGQLRRVVNEWDILSDSDKRLILDLACHILSMATPAAYRQEPMPL